MHDIVCILIIHKDTNQCPNHNPVETGKLVLTREFTPGKESPGTPEGQEAQLFLPRV